MVKANWHTYQVLTKRSERWQRCCKRSCSSPRKAPHIWWGVSVENRADGLPRINHLRSAPAGIRFLSVEPLLEDLGDMDLSGIDWVIAGGESGRRARPMKEEWVAGCGIPAATGHRILLQTMGRRPESEKRPHSRRPHL